MGVRECPNISRTFAYMTSTSLTRSLGLALTLWQAAAGTASALISLETVPVADNKSSGDLGYSYSIAKYEVTLNQYCTFLNAVAASDTYGVYNTYLNSLPQVRGISRTGTSGSYHYTVVGSGNRPVTYVSWFDAARFVNWLEHGQPTGAQGPATTETGAYTLNGAVSGMSITRNASAKYVLPNDVEWYKAAYYDPTLNGGAGGYWEYPTRSNDQPNSRFGSTTDPNSANFYYDDGLANGYNGGFAANNSITPPNGNALTDAGAFRLASSYYGTFDQGGNAEEWTEEPGDAGRVVRGGSWNTYGDLLSAYTTQWTDPTQERWDIGFRVAVIPEPGVGGLWLAGPGLIAAKRVVMRRRRH